MKLQLASQYMTWEKKSQNSFNNLCPSSTGSQVRSYVPQVPPDFLVPLGQKVHVAGGDQRERKVLNVPWDHLENLEKQEWLVVGPRREKGDKGEAGPKGMPGPPGRPGKSISAPQVILTPVEQTRERGRKYDALLYGWGQSSPFRRMELQGQKVPVRCKVFD